MQTTIETIGWLSALILMITLSRQVLVQWKNRSSKGVSAWLFVGQITSSIGFIIYSVLVHNLVFVITNSLIALVAVAGEWVDFHNRKYHRKSQ